MEANIVAGATVDRIPLTKFPEFKILLPSRDMQDRIAEVLSSYDDLLENINQQQQALIEAKGILLPKLMSGQLDVSGIPLPDDLPA